MKMKKAAAAALCLSLTAGILSLAGCSSPKPTELETFHVEGDTIKVGIISDLQLAPKGGSDTYDQSYRKALEFLKAQDVDMMINAGDYTDTATQEAVDNYAGILNEVYPQSERPISLSILGNHDYWLPNFVDCWEIPFKSTLQKRYLEAVGEKSPWTHKVVNGYHFIGFSPCNGGMDSSAYEDKIDWAREQIEIAVKEDPNKPVFVITHAPPNDTVYMSDEEDYGVLSDLFEQYPQLVSISGHTHAPLMDDRSIWQGEYTAVNTQCVSYICFEKGMMASGEDGDAIEQNPMCLIMEISADKLAFNRYSVLDGSRQGDTWEIALPIQQNLNHYTDDRSGESAAPVFPENTAVSAEFKKYESDGENELAVRFTSAVHDRYVYGYNLTMTDSNGNPVSFTDGEDDDGNPVYIQKLSYVSDFYLGFDKMAAETVVRLGSYTRDLGDGTYTLNITAMDTWGHESAPVTVLLTIDGQNVTTSPGV